MTKKVIDVSQFNGAINWPAVAPYVDAAIIRVGYRGYGAAGTLTTDARLRDNLTGARAAGLPVGVYWLSQAVTVAEARAEADFVVSQIAGTELIYPVYLDSELSNKDATGRADSISAKLRTDCAVAFCDQIRALGYTPGIYASESWFASQLDFSRLAAFTIWVAKYAASKPSTARCDAWQYTDAGTVPGISGKLDMSHFYRDFEEECDLTEEQVKKICKEVVTEILRGDNTTVSAALRPEYEQAKAKGITDGTRPGGYATRAQVAAMVVRALKT